MIMIIHHETFGDVYSHFIPEKLREKGGWNDEIEEQTNKEYQKAIDDALDKSVFTFVNETADFVLNTDKIDQWEVSDEVKALTVSLATPLFKILIPDDDKIRERNYIKSLEEKIEKLTLIVQERMK